MFLKKIRKILISNFIIFMSFLFVNNFYGGIFVLEEIFTINDVYANGSDDNKENCVDLNTTLPIIGSEICEDGKSAFASLMGGLSNIMVVLIIIISFLFLVAGGVLITMAGADQESYNKGKELIMKVIIGIFLLGASGVILNVINPNFFS